MSILTPEARARRQIDRMLAAAGWIVRDRADFNPAAGPGIAVREFPLKTGSADYLLLVDRKAVGAVEAKKVGTPLSGVESQSARYSDGLPNIPPAWHKPLPFLYESTGVETFFTNGLDPDPRSRQLFAFHWPETLRAWAQAAATLRTHVLALPELDRRALWPVQTEAIENLERSLRDNRPRALIQMATGTGKTFTAVNFVYRLIKYAGARRVLFLVDRGNLGRQAYKEFQQFVTPDDGRKFTELYNVQHLQANVLDDVSRVCITTVQRLYSILSGEPDFDAANEEASLFDGDLPAEQPSKQVIYNPAIPIEYFDVIVIDECHRSIYNVWRQVLEYFDAFLIGLTATPSKQTFGKKSSVSIVTESGDNKRASQTIEREDFWKSTSNKQLNFVQHVKSMLAEHGRAAVVVPDNVLFEGGAGETIRRKLLHECDLHTLLRLPTGIFYAQGVKANVLFFDRKPASETPWTRHLWIYDLRTNVNLTLRKNPLTETTLADFIACYNPENRHERLPTWGEQTPEGRWRRYSYDELVARDKANLDIFWLRDEGIDDGDALLEPDELAAAIVEDLAAALEQFREIVADLEET